MIRGAREKEKYLKVFGLENPVNLNDFLTDKSGKILIVSMKRVGDLIVTLPLIKAVKDFFPKTILTVMSAPEYESLLLAQPYIDEFTILPDSEYQFYRIGSEYDLIISLRKWFKQPESYFNFPPYFIFSTDILLGPQKHAHLHYLDALSILGIKSRPKRPCIKISSTTAEYARRFFKAFNFRSKDIIIAVHPGSGYEAKNWPLERYKSLLYWLSECYNPCFVLIKGKDEDDILEIVKDIPEDRVALLFGLPLMEVAAVLSKCTFFIGNDSGVMHIADAVGCPTLTIFGPSRSRVWGATGQNAVHLVREDVWSSCPYCSGRHLKDMPCLNPTEKTCLRSIQVKDAIKGIESLAALIRLRNHFKHIDAIKISNNLLKFSFGLDGLLIANLAVMNPLYIKQGRKMVEACLGAVENHGLYSIVVNKEKIDKDLLDALMIYRIVIPEHEVEDTLENKEKEEKTNVLTNPLLIQMGIESSNNYEIDGNSYLSAKKHNSRKKKPEKSSKSKLRILFINSIHSSIYGGGERWMLKTGIALADRGHEVLCWGFPGHKWISDAQQNNLYCLSRNLPSVFNIDEIPNLIRYIKKLRLDATILNHDRDVMALAPSFYIADVPAVIARKGLPYVDGSSITGWVYRNSVHKIITPSIQIRNEMIENNILSPDRVEVIPNGVKKMNNSHKFSELNMLYDELNLNDSDKIILTVGRLTAQKGTIYLIKSIPEVLRRVVSAKLIIVGHGKERKILTEEVEKLGISHAVRFLGERWDVDRLLSISDCFVLPSLYEGMSSAMLEAMEGGVPVIATEVYGALDVIKNEETGILIPPANVRAIAKSIIRILTYKKMNSEIAKKGQIHVRAKYSFDTMIDSVENLLFQSVLI